MVVAILAIVPLYVLGASADWRRALRACFEYIAIMAAFLLVGGGLGVLAFLVENI
jgi:hypothetical protein